MSDEIDEALKPGSDFWKWDAEKQAQAAASELAIKNAFGRAFNKLYRSLLRHRERYIRAWMAHYRAHPADVHIVTRMQMDGGEIMRMEFRHDSDPVLKLVKAARAHIVSQREDIYGHPTDELEAALKPFEGG